MHNKAEAVNRSRGAITREILMNGMISRGVREGQCSLLISKVTIDVSDYN